MDKPAIKDRAVLAYVEYLENKLNIFESSPNVESYLTVYNQVRSFNEQLKLGEMQTTIGENGIKETTQKGFVDLFASKDDKSFDRTKWYFENVLSLNKTLAEIRKLMTPEEVKETDTRKIADTATAEKYIFKDQK